MMENRTAQRPAKVLGNWQIWRQVNGIVCGRTRLDYHDILYEFNCCSNSIGRSFHLHAKWPEIGNGYDGDIAISKPPLNTFTFRVARVMNNDNNTNTNNHKSSDNDNKI